MNNEKALLFVGGIYTEDKINEILSKSKRNPQMAANNFQWGLIHGFDEVLHGPVTILNELFIGSYPRNYKDPIIFPRRFSHVKNAEDIELGFINICYFKQILRPFGERRFIKKWLEEHNGANVFIYALTNRTIRIAKYIKKISSDTKIMVSVNDLPQHIMKAKDGNPVVDLWKKIQTRTVYSGLKYIDGFMLVAERQSDILGINKDRSVIVEAITDKMKYEYIPLKPDQFGDVKNIVYTGTLAIKYNILNLVNAFMQIHDKDIRLIICGDGEAKEEIQNKAKIDNRIIFKGVIPKEEVYKELHSAWVLVNPRNKGQVFTDYSFPIKTIDYLSAGRPVICQRLEAIPEEYDEHLIYFEASENDKSLVDTITHVLGLSIDEIEVIGRHNIDFVNENKTPQVQTKKILDLFERL